MLRAFFGCSRAALALVLNLAPDCYTARLVTASLARVFACCAAALTSGAVLIAAPRSDAFGVGVLRSDGIIVPFAAFGGKRWVANWPPPNLELDVPISMRDVPSKWWGPTAALEQWQAWTTTGTSMAAQSLRVEQPDWIDVHCTRQIGLRTDYKPAEPPPPRTVQPYPKDGLVVSPPHAVERIAIVPPVADDAGVLMASLHEAFNKAERQVENEYGHPVSRRAREGRLPDIEAVYAVGEHPRVYYVEATRRYRILGQAATDCEAIGFGTGWFTREGSQVRALDMSVGLLACDRRGAGYMLPLGAMRLSGTLYWLAQFSGWDHERYVVIEVKEKAVKAVVNSWGGSC
jgi:hypothetical protein